MAQENIKGFQLNAPPNRSPDPQVAIQTENLSIRYGSSRALENVTLAIPEREITAIIGPSGCGKSSFLQSINRITDMVPQCYVEGSLRLFGQEIFGPNIDLIALRRRVGMIFQKPNPFPLSIQRNIELPLKEHGVNKKTEREQITHAVLQEVGLWDEVKDRLGISALKLSGGQQQRLCIARSLALKPEVLLFDEPCSALDPISSRVVEDLVLSLRTKTTVVVVTHNLSQAQRIADHVAMFWYQDECGCMIETGPASTVFKNPNHRVTADFIQGTTG